jgi:replicative DNA helicase
LTSPESEQAVLGALILDPEGRGAVLEVLRPEHFLSPANRTIFEAVADLYVSRRDFDALQIVADLRSRGALDEVGGTKYLHRIMDEVPIITDGLRYAENVIGFSQRRRMLRACEELQNDLLKNPDFDGARVLARMVNALADGKAAAALSPMSDLISDAIESGVQETANRPLTGLGKLDSNFNPFTPCEVTIVAGRPGCGKSTLMRQIVAAAARGMKVLLFSLEVSAKVLSHQILCECAGVPYYDLRKGAVTEEQKALLVQYMGYDTWQNILICEKTSLTAMDVSIQLTRTLAKGEQIGLVAVDYLGLMKHPKSERNDLSIAETTRAMKQIALERKVPVMLLAQLNREVEKRGGSGGSDRPRLSDLRDSGAIEQDADNIVFLWRRDREAEYSVVEERVLTVAKHRNGAVFELDLLFDKQRGRFTEQTHGSDAGRDGRAAASGE